MFFFVCFLFSRLTNETSLGVSFETCFRRPGDVLIGLRLVLLRRRYDVSIKRHGGLPLRRLGDVPSTRSWVFHLRRTYNVAGTYRDMSLQRHDVLLPGEK